MAELAHASPRPLSIEGRILVVDDNELNRDMLCRRLARKGFEVLGAESGEGCLELLRAESVDLVLLDIEMPSMSGYEVLRRIRETESLARLPVVMVTSRAASEDIVQALAAGANDYVTKPIDFAVALARVRTQLALKTAEAALRRSEERYALAARGTNDGLWDWDIDSGRIYFSPRWNEILGFSEDELGSDPEEWFRRVHPADIERVRAQIGAHVAGQSAHFESEHRMLHRDGNLRWVLTRGIAVRATDGRPVRMAGSLTDVTASRVADPLTGLPNRLLLKDRLDRCLERSRRRDNAPFAVLILDLDRFNLVNDSLGREVGDELIVALARRIEARVRSADVVGRFSGDHTLARLGGDEFTLVMEDIGNPSNAGLIAARLLEALEDPFDVGGQRVFVRASIGIAVGGIRYVDSDAVLRDADAALHRAKARGGNTYEMFDPEMRESARCRLQLDTDMRHALDRDQFIAHYQPIVTLPGARLRGFEALARWNHPQRGTISPAEFIPLAEESGLITEVGDMILRQACRQARAWADAGVLPGEFRISVNLSALQLAAPDLVDKLEAALSAHGLRADVLNVEITESVLMGDAHRAATALRQVRDLGVHISIDDFGTGFSSLSYLHDLAADSLKIDRSFINRITSDQNSFEIVRAIVELAHNLRMSVVAEGVETPAQAAALVELGCEFAQGFYYSRPLVDRAAGDLLAANRPVRGRGEDG